MHATIGYICRPVSSKKEATVASLLPMLLDCHCLGKTTVDRGQLQPEVTGPHSDTNKHSGMDKFQEGQNSWPN